VGGPGAKTKVYVNPTGAVAGASTGPQAAGVVGAQGGWRRIDNTALTVESTETVLEFPQINALFQALEPEVALTNVPFENPTSKTVLTYTVFYWEEPSGNGQDALYPAYDLTAQYVGMQGGETVTVTDHTYLPAAPTYMRPYAEIIATSDLGRNYAPGQVFTATAANATQTLTTMGYDALLNFALGSGTYFYNWYLVSADDPEGRISIGTGRNLSWQIPVGVLGFGKDSPAPQTVVLEVTDTSPHTAQSTSQDTTVFTAVPPIYLPMVTKTF